MVDLVVGVLLSVLGAGLGAVFVQRLRLRARLKRRGVDTVGVVSNVTRSKEHNSSTVIYRDAQGQGHYLLFATVVGAKGKKVTVCYDPEQPGDAIVREVSGLFVVWLIFALPPLLVGLRLIYGWALAQG